MTTSTPRFQLVTTSPPPVIFKTGQKEKGENQKLQELSLLLFPLRIFQRKLTNFPEKIRNPNPRVQDTSTHDPQTLITPLTTMMPSHDLLSLTSRITFSISIINGTRPHPLFRPIHIKIKINRIGESRNHRMGRLRARSCKIMESLFCSQRI